MKEGKKDGYTADRQKKELNEENIYIEGQVWLWNQCFLLHPSAFFSYLFCKSFETIHPEGHATLFYTWENESLDQKLKDIFKMSAHERVKRYI